MMESTVINRDNNSIPTQAQPMGATNTTNASAAGPHSTPIHTQHTEQDDDPSQDQWMRQNPYFFDMDDPYDFFTNPALRTRLSRFQNPFNSVFGQMKRRNSPPSGNPSAGHHPHHHSDPHQDFFASHFDRVPGWSSHNNSNSSDRGHPLNAGSASGGHSTSNNSGGGAGSSNSGRRMPGQGGGAGGVHVGGGKGSANNDMFNHIPSEFRHYLPEEFGFHPRPPHPTQAAGTTRDNSGDKLGRPQFCDAAMQTDDIGGAGVGDNAGGHEHGHNHQQQAHQPHQQQQQQHQKPGHYATADAGVGQSPNGSFASAHAYSSSGPQPQPQQRQERSNSNSMGNVRRVPIIIEGQPMSSSIPKDSPINRMGGGGAPYRSARDVPIQHEGVPHHHQQQQQQQEPPQSPSIESINKIQSIQQDVLDLMFKVEQFSGASKNDKDYKYLDEMLTRSLLKLDTIDTNGNDSIRLARKEAIKCIQASLSVLEAKAEGRPTVVPLPAPEGCAVQRKEEMEGVEELKEGDKGAAQAAGSGGVESMDTVVQDENNNNDNDKKSEGVENKQGPMVVMMEKEKKAMKKNAEVEMAADAMMGVEQQVPAPTIRDCTSDDEEEEGMMMKSK